MKIKGKLIKQPLAYIVFCRYLNVNKDDWWVLAAFRMRYDAEAFRKTLDMPTKIFRLKTPLLGHERE